jgi:hypothetical protein
MLQSCNYSKILYNLRCTTQAKRFRSSVRLQHHDAESLADSTDRCIVQTVLEITGSTLEEAERLITWKSKGPQARGTLHRTFPTFVNAFPFSTQLRLGRYFVLVLYLRNSPGAKKLQHSLSRQPASRTCFIRYDFMLVSITRA